MDNENENGNEFITLINSITQIPDDKIEQTYQDYLSFIETLKVNEQLINEMKTQIRAAGGTVTQVLADKELILEYIDTLTKHEELATEKMKLIDAVKDSIVIVYDKIAETFDYDMINIPVELCDLKAKMPTYAHENDAGFDFYLIEDLELQPNETKIARTGVKLAIPNGYELQIRPRSGNSLKTALRIANAPGTIDSGYRDEIGIICWNSGSEVLHFSEGDKIAQGVLSRVPKAVFQPIDDITTIIGNRNGGFGSTDQK